LNVAPLSLRPQAERHVATPAGYVEQLQRSVAAGLTMTGNLPPELSADATGQIQPSKPVKCACMLNDIEPWLVHELPLQSAFSEGSQGHGGISAASS
jgi:hypothetical protein